MKKLILCIAFVALQFTGTFQHAPIAAEKYNPKDLAVGDFFDGQTGTIVLKNLKTDQTYVYNKNRSIERYTPESTFKIPNALIGLQTRSVADEYEVKRWDGIHREIPEWNRDHTLGSGMRHSVIWYYQQMARDIGASNMQKYLDLIQYGNMDISEGIDQFWLDGGLRISAKEQAAFLEKLVEERLSFNKQNMRTVKRMMINEEEDSYVLHGKTGTRLSDYRLGWYVGYIETDQTVWVFATNIDGSGSKARSITMKVLEEMNIMD